MKLHHTPTSDQNRFTGYGATHVLVNSTRYENSLLVFPDRIEPWEASGFESLAERHFELILEFSPEVLLLGTGDKQRFCHPRLYRSLIANRIGVEIMDNAAACRTYNFLMEEGRRVGAALLLA